MAFLGRDVAEQSCRSRDGGDQQIHAAVVVNVAAGQSAAYHCSLTEWDICQGYVLKFASAIVDKELISLGVLAPMRTESGTVRNGSSGDSAVDDGQVQGAVVIEIGQHRAETGASPAGTGQTRRRRPIPKQASRLLKPERVQFLR